jgi:hypothetical protein
MGWIKERWPGTLMLLKMFAQLRPAALLIAGQFTQISNDTLT